MDFSQIDVIKEMCALNFCGHKSEAQPMQNLSLSCLLASNMQETSKHSNYNDLESFGLDTSWLQAICEPKLCVQGTNVATVQ